MFIVYCMLYNVLGGGAGGGCWGKGPAATVTVARTRGIKNGLKIQSALHARENKKEQ